MELLLHVVAIRAVPHLLVELLLHAVATADVLRHQAVVVHRHRAEADASAVVADCWPNYSAVATRVAAADAASQLVELLLHVVATAVAIRVVLHLLVDVLLLLHQSTQLPLTRHRRRRRL